MPFASFQGLPDFLAYLATVAALCIFHVFVFPRATFFDEYRLIVEKLNASAALERDAEKWGPVFRDNPAPTIWNHISRAIEQHALASAQWPGFVSIAPGLLSAASVSGRR